MKEVKRKIIAIILMCGMCFVFASAIADVNIMSSGGSIAVEGYSFDLDSSTGLVRYDASVTGVTGVSSVYVATVVQRKVNGAWVNVPNTFASASESGVYAIAGGQRYVEKGYWYRTENTFISYLNGVQTKHVTQSDTQWYN